MEEKSHLKKTLGFIDVFSLASGAMISSGIFILPALAFARVGPAMFLSYMIAGILALLGALSVIELATAMPKAGGDYYFIERSMGPLIGTISGILSYFALCLKSSFAILGLAQVALLLSGMSLSGNMHFDVFILGSIFILFFCGLNILGVKEAAKLEVFMVVGLLLLLGFFVFAGISKVKIPNFEPFVASGGGLGSILAVSGLVFVSFGGLLKVSSVAEEVKNPGRNIKLGMLCSVVVVSILYVFITIVLVGVMDAEVLKNSLSPMAEAARIFSGSTGFVVVSIAAILAFLTTANAGMMAASRYPMALSKDKLLPDRIARIHPKFKTPVTALLISSFIMSCSLLLDLDSLAKAASTVILLSYLLSNLAVIILRESHLQNYRPTFKVPFYPWLQLIGIGVFGFLIVDMGAEAMGVAFVMVLVAVLAYGLYGRNVTREYALMHLIERISNRKLTSHHLEKELRDIIQRRDDVVMDDFDLLAKSAPVLIIDKKLSKEALFRRISEHFCSFLKISKEEMFELLTEREIESSTVIGQKTAVPHLILEGKGSFGLFPVKCTKNIDFGEDGEVNALFVLAGSRDERQKHLKSLAAIAQIIQSSEFEKRWQSAKNEKQIRDLLLLSKRKRN